MNYYEEIKENLLTVMDRSNTIGSARLLFRKNTGEYCVFACPSGCFEMEYINDGDCPWS